MFGMKKEAVPGGDKAEAPAGSQYLTRAECSAMITAAVDAAIDAQAIVNREIAGGARDAFFSPGKLEGRLAEEAEGLPKPVARCLQRSVDAMSGKVAKSFGVDRGSQRAPGQPWST